MKIPFNYTIKNFKTRRLTTLITIAGVAMVVFVFAAVLMMAYGVQKTLVATGEKDNVKVYRKAASAEITSIITGDIQDVIRTFPYIAKTSDGKPIISNETVVIINLAKKEGGLSNVTVRGVSPTVNELRSNVKIIQGRTFNPSLRELIVGESISNRFAGAQIGSTIKFANNEWKIVGVFSTKGSGFDSELWGDALQLLDAFGRANVVSTVTLTLDDSANFN